jgi:hypothetical protein
MQISILEERKRERERERTEDIFEVYKNLQKVCFLSFLNFGFSKMNDKFQTQLQKA